MKNLARFDKWLPVLAVSLFFVGFLVIGLSIYKDFGVYFDEAAQVTIGDLNYQYIKTGDYSKLNYQVFYGAVFELATIFSTRFLPPNWHYADLYFVRHLDVFLTFWASGIAFFWLIKKKFNSWKLGLLGSAFLFFSPVIFGNAFYNSKDIPLLAMYIFSLLTLTLFLERPGWLTAAAHALSSAILIDIRLLGMIIPALTVGLALLQMIVPNRKEWAPNPRRLVMLTLVYLGLMAGLIILFFPAIWPNPLQLILSTFQNMTHRSWTCCCNLMLGNCYNYEQIPWFHVPVWMGVTTPPLYLVLFFLGLFPAVGAFRTAPWLHLTREKWQALLYLGALFLPVLAIVMARTVVYNGWRHMYFIYAPFLVLAVGGFDAAQRWLKARYNARAAAAVLGLVTLATFVSTGVFMIQAHPYEFVYFNFLAGRDMAEVKQNYELDYWGLSYTDGLRYILKNDTRSPIRINSNIKSIAEFSFILPDEDQARLKIVETPAEADYYLTDYYMHPADYDYPNEFYSVWVGNAKILSVFKLKP
jgi:hypothetical protein